MKPVLKNHRLKPPAFISAVGQLSFRALDERQLFVRNDVDRRYDEEDVLRQVIEGFQYGVQTIVGFRLISDGKGVSVVEGREEP